MSDTSTRPTSSWASIDQLLDELIAESEASVQDWIRLSSKLGALQTEVQELSDSLAESRRLYDSSEASRRSEQQAGQSLAQALEARASKAEASARAWRVALEIGAPVALAVGCMAGWIMASTWGSR